MDDEDVTNAIREVERLAYCADAGPNSSPSPDIPPAVYAQLAHAWALVAVARALTLHADRLPPA